MSPSRRNPAGTIHRTKSEEEKKLACERERQRVVQHNKSYAKLKKVIPYWKNREESDKPPTRLEILRAAAHYIQFLKDLLELDKNTEKNRKDRSEEKTENLENKENQMTPNATVLTFFQAGQLYAPLSPY